MGNHTPLYDAHVRMGAKIVDFAGWDMPIQYGSQLEEHRQVRESAGIFDVSHMTVIDLTGAQSREFLKKLLANNVNRLQDPGKALYSCLLNEQGGVIDDLIAYFIREDWFRLVVNAATRAKDLEWIGRQAAGFEVSVTERPELAMIAVQGPKARDLTRDVLAERYRGADGLKPFFALVDGVGPDDWFVARTGYTGEDGFEIILPAAEADAFWQALAAAGVHPIGLGARDTLRLEAGMNLYGSDMSEDTTPLVSGLGWTVAWEPETRDFIGRAALEAQRRSGAPQQLVGLVLEGKGVLRNHQRVITPQGDGEITSGGFSPTMKASIALARIPAGVETDAVTVAIRGKEIPARIVKPPFVRNGEIKV